MAGPNRLLKEYREMVAARSRRDPNSGVIEPILYEPKDEANLYRWTARIVGPSDTPFAHHRFTLSFTIPPSYPHTPPTVVFTTPIAHPNVHPRTGEICLDILKDAWSPIWNIESLCRAIIALMASGDATSPLNCDCGNLIRAGDWRGYWNLARFWTIEFAERVEPDHPSDRHGWKKLEKEEREKQSKTAISGH